MLAARRARRRRKLPERYAHEFMRRAKRGWFNDSIGWEEFAALMHERESFTLRAYNSLQLNRSGHLVMPAITSSLRRLGLPATEENASAMLRYLGRAQDGYISYGEFRNFLLLLPPEQVRGTDPSVLWFEAATFVQLRAPAVAAGASGLALLKAALAGALASGSSTAVMHPLDTLKTRVQASVGRAPGLRGLARMIPELGARRLYLGIIPAVAGTATSHGIRTASYEWARVMLSPLLGLPGVSDTAIQGIASGFGTFLGTGVRIPNEVLKQRLQTGQHAHVLEAVRAVIRGGGIAGLFAGTTATLAREVPFYVLGMVAYERLKAVARSATGRELTSWQTIAVGALSGAAAAVATTPADVLKTRIMTGRAPAGLGALALAQRMIAEEGISSLYKGAAPRALWIAPLGAMNFAGAQAPRRGLCMGYLPWVGQATLRCIMSLPCSLMHCPACCAQDTSSPRKRSAQLRTRSQSSPRHHRHLPPSPRRRLQARRRPRRRAQWMWHRRWVLLAHRRASAYGRLCLPSLGKRGVTCAARRKLPPPRSSRPPLQPRRTSRLPLSRELACCKSSCLLLRLLPAQRARPRLQPRLLPRVFCQSRRLRLPLMRPMRSTRPCRLWWTLVLKRWVRRMLRRRGARSCRRGIRLLDPGRRFLRRRWVWTSPPTSHKTILQWLRASSPARRCWAVRRRQWQLQVMLTSSTQTLAAVRAPTQAGRALRTNDGCTGRVSYRCARSAGQASQLCPKPSPHP